MAMGICVWRGLVLMCRAEWCLDSMVDVCRFPVRHSVSSWRKSVRRALVQISGTRSGSASRTTATMPLVIQSLAVEWNLGRPRWRRALFDFGVLVATLCLGVGLLTLWEVTTNVAFCTVMMATLMHLEQTVKRLVSSLRLKGSHNILNKAAGNVYCGFPSVLCPLLRHHAQLPRTSSVTLDAVCASSIK